MTTLRPLSARAHTAARLLNLYSRARPPSLLPWTPAVAAEPAAESSPQRLAPVGKHADHERSGVDPAARRERDPEIVAVELDRLGLRHREGVAAGAQIRDVLRVVDEVDHATADFGL